MAHEQGFFVARIINVENTSGPLLRHLPEGVRALVGQEVGTTISIGGPRGLDVIGLSTTPEAARDRGKKLAEWRKNFAPWEYQPEDIVIRVEPF